MIGMNRAASSRITSVYCVSLLRQSTAVLSEDFGEGDFDLDGFSSEHAVFDFTAALGRMHVRPMAFRINYPNIRNTEGQIVGDFLFEITRAIIRREHLHNDRRRFADDPLGWFGA